MPTAPAPPLPDPAKRVQAIASATTYLRNLTPPQGPCLPAEADAIIALAAKGGIDGLGAPCLQYPDGPTVRLWREWIIEIGASPDMSKHIPDPQHPGKFIYVPTASVATINNR